MLCLMAITLISSPILFTSMRFKVDNCSWFRVYLTGNDEVRSCSWIDSFYCKKIHVLLYYTPFRASLLDWRILNYMAITPDFSVSMPLLIES